MGLCFRYAKLALGRSISISNMGGGEKKDEDEDDALASEGEH